jgi:hypothetical protein
MDITYIVTEKAEPKSAEIGPLLTQSEPVIYGMKGPQNEVWITERRVIAVEKLPLSSKRTYRSYFISKISAIEVETPGLLQHLGEIKISGSGFEFKVKSTKGVNVAEVAQVIAELI